MEAQTSAYNPSMVLEGEMSLESSSDDETYVSDRELLNPNNICSDAQASQTREKILEIQTKILAHLGKERLIVESEVTAMLQTLRDLKDLTPQEQFSVESAMMILMKISVGSIMHQVPKSQKKLNLKFNPKKSSRKRKTTCKKRSSASLFSKDCLEFNNQQKLESVCSNVFDKEQKAEINENIEISRNLRYLNHSDLNSEVNINTGTIDINMDFLTNNNFGCSVEKGLGKSDSFLHKLSVSSQFISSSNISDHLNKPQQISEVNSFPIELLTNNNFTNTQKDGYMSCGSNTVNPEENNAGIIESLSTSQKSSQTLVFPLELITNTDFTNTVNSLGFSQALQIFQNTEHPKTASEELFSKSNAKSQEITYSDNNTIQETEYSVSESQDMFFGTNGSESMEVTSKQPTKYITSLLKSMIDRNIPKNVAMDILSESFSEIKLTQEIEDSNAGEAMEIEIYDLQSKPILIKNVELKNFRSTKLNTINELPNEEGTDDEEMEIETGSLNKQSSGDSFMNIKESRNNFDAADSSKVLPDMTCDQTNSGDQKLSKSEKIRNRKDKLRPIWNTLPDEKKITIENIRKFGINPFENPVETFLNLDVEYEEPDLSLESENTDDFHAKLTSKLSDFDYGQLINAVKTACEEAVTSAIEEEKPSSDTESESERKFEKEKEKWLVQMEMEHEKFIAERKSEIEAHRAEAMKRRAELRNSINRKLPAIEMVQLMKDMEKFRKNRNLRSLLKDA